MARDLKFDFSSIFNEPRQQQCASHTAAGISTACRPHSDDHNWSSKDLVSFLAYF